MHVLSAYEVIGTRPQTSDDTTLKLPTTILDTPRSVTVLDSTRIRQQGFENASEMLFWIPGMNSNGDSYHFYARGFRMLPNDWKIDGFVGRTISGSFAPYLYGVEQVVALKGPASLLYGATSSPGGQISLETKRPKEIPMISVYTRLRTYAGSESNFVGGSDGTGAMIEFDATGPVAPRSSNAERLLYRLQATYDHAIATPRSADDNQYYSLALTYKFDAAGRYKITPVVEYTHTERANRSPIISPLTNKNVGAGNYTLVMNDTSPRDIALTEGTRNDDTLSAGADFNAKLIPATTSQTNANAWNLNAAFRYTDRTYEGNLWNLNTATLAQTNPADSRSWTIKRKHSRSKSSLETYSLDINSDYEFLNTTNAKSLIQVGFNTRWQDSQAYTAPTLTTAQNPDQSPINIYIGQASAPLIAYVPDTFTRGTLTRTTTWNAYAQSQSKFFKKIILTLSFGYTGDNTRAITPVNITTSDISRNSDITPNASLAYRLTPNLTAYASYSTSYNLPSATVEDINGNTGTFSPIEGDSYEIGLKADLWHNRIFGSVALFDTTQNKVMTLSDASQLNPNGNQYYTQTNTGRKSRGAEVEINLRPISQWETSLTYAYIDAYDRDAAGNRASSAELTPKHAASAYTRYTISKGVLTGVYLRAGAIWQNTRWAASGAPKSLRFASYWRFDAGAGYRWKRWDFSLSAENLTDEYYMITGTSGTGLNPVNPRSLTLRVGYVL